MSYQAIARRWRPQSFEEVVGQQAATQTLINAIKSGRTSHAYLFTGPRGVGKTTVARILAKALNCQSGPTPQPCQTCPSCREITRGSSLEVMEIDGASNRGIDEIRELREVVKFAPSRDRYKVYIIDEVHMLTKEAFNALLKTLEEPPPHVVFVFATTEAHKIPATILSRCQRFDFKRLSAKEIEAQLIKIAREEKIEIEPLALLSLCHYAEGSLRDAQSLLDQMISFCGEKITPKDVEMVLGLVDQELLSSLIEALIAGDSREVLLLVEKASEKGYDLRQLTMDLLDYLRDLLLIKGGAPQMVEKAASLVEILKAQSQKFSPEFLSRALETLLPTEADMRRSTLPRLILETALVKLTLAKTLVPLEEVLAQLSQIETGASASPEPPMPLSLFEPRPPTQSTARPLPLPLPEPPARPADAPDEPEDLSPPPLPELTSEEETTPPAQEISPALHVCWQTIKDKIRRQRPGLLALLEGAKKISLEENRLLIMVGESNSFSQNIVNDRENREFIRRVFAECFGKDYPVEIIFGPGSAMREKPSSPAPVAETHHGELGRHQPPLIQEALELFQGKVVPPPPAGGVKKKAGPKPKAHGSK